MKLPFLKYLTNPPQTVQLKNTFVYGRTNVAIHLALLMHVSWAILFGFTGVNILLTFNIISLLWCTYTIRLNRHGHHLTAAAIVLGGVLIHAFAATWILGQMGFEYFCFLAFVLPFTYPEKRSVIKYLLVLFSFIVFLICSFYLNDLDRINSLNQAVLSWIVIYNILLSSGFMVLFTLMYNSAIDKTEVLLEQRTTQLIQGEKMASIGQLSAGVAHEVNTPLGAIKASAEDFTIAFDNTYEILPTLLVKLEPEVQDQFWEFVAIARQTKPNLSSREEREKRKILREELGNLEIQNTRYLADRLVQMGVEKIDEKLAAILKHNSAEEMITLAYHISNQTRNADNIRLAVSKAARIVKALKKYMHSDEINARSLINLREGMETVLTIYHNQLKYGIELEKNFEETQNINANAEQLTQVWTNLVHNSIQAMEYKGKLTIEIKEENENLVVSVKDNGPGIPAEVQPRVFDPFFTTKKAGEGSGLGLDIAKKIVDDHGGRIWFETEKDKGTAFHVSLPIT